MQQIRGEYKPTGPLPLQYAKWLRGLAQGDLGTSIFSGRPVTEELLLRVPTSLELGLIALVLTLVVAVPVGVLSAARQDSWTGYLARGGAILFYAIHHSGMALSIILHASSSWTGSPASKEIVV